ncbi:nuclease-related domain-containing DEAD/DEAH box helicase [Paenibacillus illinoisensis]|uniref:nuclease-related domain-containing DEAD/DEAH box helicase n=1 Tax=Paenibacillus illinoisensis TaxID=59845 RepID=UPI0030181604
MAIFFPTLDVVKQLKVLPTEGEWHLLEFLADYLDDTYEVFFQPQLNGDNPDIIVLRKGTGAWIIEVKDWHLQHYYVKRENIWGLVNHRGDIKSPLDQVQRYKDNMYSLHIEGLLESKVWNSSMYAVFQTAVYFHNETEERAQAFVHKEARSDHRYFDILGKNSLNAARMRQLLRKRRLDRTSKLFTDDVYINCLRYLKPSLHGIENTEPIIYNKKQIELIQSKSVHQKIKGVAGSGKTLVLAKRAVNAFLRTEGRVLVLTFNISLKNYIHDQISRIREDIAWNNFEIINYHQFFNSKCNNLNLIPHRNDYENVDFFTPYKESIIPYDVVLIDEIQDFRIEWQRIIRQFFLVDNGEFVLFGDEKQNIYGRELEQQKIKTTVPGAWNKLEETYRLSNRVCELVSTYQESFLTHKYEKDDFQLLLDFSSPKSESLQYYYTNEHSTDHVGDLYKMIRSMGAHPNDVCFLGMNVDILQKFDFYIRDRFKERTTTTFESLETNRKLIEENHDSQSLKMQIDELRRSKKANFWMNASTTKLSTIHSFKGWEINNLVLIIEGTTEGTKPEELNTMDELIYTGLTRCKKNLLIVNIANEKYHSFFAEHHSLFDRFDPDWKATEQHL